MLREFEIPDELRKQIGGFYIVAAHKDALDDPHMIMRDGDEILLGPLLTAGETEALIPAVTAFYVAMMFEKTAFGIGLVRLEEGDYTGRFNALFALDPEGKTLPPQEYETVLDGLRGTLASQNQTNIDWLDTLPPQVRKAAAKEVRTVVSDTDEQGGTIRTLLAAYADPAKRDTAIAMTDIFLASGGSLPANLLRDLFRVRLIDRWGRRAGDDVV